MAYLLRFGRRRNGDEPPGMTTVLNSALDSMPSGWTTSDGSHTLFRDGSTYTPAQTTLGVDLDPPGVCPGALSNGLLELWTPKDKPAGQGSGAMYRASTFSPSVKTVYVRGWYKVSSNHYGADDGQWKNIQPLTSLGTGPVNSSDNRIVVSVGYGVNNAATLQPRVAYQNVEAIYGQAGHSTGNLSPKSVTPAVQKQQWHEFTGLFIGNDAGKENGITLLTLDGVVSHFRRNDLFDNANFLFKNVNFTNLRGGSTPAAPDDEYIWWGRIYVSTSTSRVLGL